MVRPVLSLGICLVLRLGVWGQAADGYVQLRIRSDPPDAAVFSVDGSEQYCPSAAEPFQFSRARLKVGKTTLSQAAFLLRKKGYRDANFSIPSEQVLYAPGNQLDWPQGESVVTLTPLAGRYPMWLLGAMPVVAGGLWMRFRRRHKPLEPLLEDRTPATGPSVPWELQPGYRVGKYQVQQRLGEGVSAVVYRVVDDDQPELPLALKLLKPAESRDGKSDGRFRREMTALARLRHANIPFLFDFGEHQGLFYLVMEFLPGQNLRQRMLERPLSMAEASDVTVQLANALAAAHKQGVLHRDVKPENVVWGEDGRLKLTDFGLARSHDSSTLTVEGTLLGTPSYMAPELVAGGTSSPASDQYSLCCLAYELFCGRPPFQGESPLAIAVQHIHSPVPDPVDLPSEVRRCLLVGLAKEPEQRFAGVDSLAQNWPKVG